VYDQDFYAIVQSLKKWKYYLIPKEFVLYIDHKALQYLGSHHKLNQRHRKSSLLVSKNTSSFFLVTTTFSSLEL